MNILVLNGPNINMIGIREKEIYGEISYQAIINLIEEEAKKRQVSVRFYQSNHEGDLVDCLQQAYFDGTDGIIINPAAYTHTSIAIADAIKAIAPLPVVEVHLSDIQTRERFRHHSYSAPYCIAQIKGHQAHGYIEAMDLLIEHLRTQGKSDEE